MRHLSPIPTLLLLLLLLSAISVDSLHFALPPPHGSCEGRTQTECLLLLRGQRVQCTWAPATKSCEQKQADTPSANTPSPPPLSSSSSRSACFASEEHACKASSGCIWIDETATCSKVYVTKRAGFSADRDRLHKICRQKGYSAACYAVRFEEEETRRVPGARCGWGERSACTLHDDSDEEESARACHIDEQPHPFYTRFGQSKGALCVISALLFLILTALILIVFSITGILDEDCSGNTSTRTVKVLPQKERRSRKMYSNTLRVGCERFPLSPHGGGGVPGVMSP